MNIITITLFVLGILCVMGLVISTSSLRYKAVVKQKDYTQNTSIHLNLPKDAYIEDDYKRVPNISELEIFQATGEFYKLAEVRDRQKYLLEQSSFYEDGHDNFYSLN